MTELITRDELKTRIDAGEVTVVDALGGACYEQQHLPGTTELTEDHVEAKANALLLDKDAAMALYGSNAACGNGQAVASKLQRLGYTRVRKYREGIQDWGGAGLPVKTGA